MVSGIDTSLIARVSSIVPAAGLFTRNDEDDSQNTVGRTGASTLTGGAASSALASFGNGDGRGAEDEGPFFVSGLNGLLAPPSIAAVQEGNENSEQQSPAIYQPSQPASGVSEEAAPAEGASSEDEEGPDGLTEEEQEVVDELKQRDAEVRRHEQAHKAVGGQYAGAISFTYESGPDGQRYAVGGEVPIETGPVPGDPEATIRKLEQVRRAALAPAEPSSADQAVAAQASQGIQQARAELAQQTAEELQALTEGGETDSESGENAAGADSSGAPSGDDAAPGLTLGQGAATIEGAPEYLGRSGAPSNDAPFSIPSSDSDGGAFAVSESRDFSGLVDEGESDPYGFSGGGNQTRSSPFDVTPVRVFSTLDVSI